jgi:hypothetical protein
MASQRAKSAHGWSRRAIDEAAPRAEPRRLVDRHAASTPTGGRPIINSARPGDRRSGRHSRKGSDMKMLRASTLLVLATCIGASLAPTHAFAEAAFERFYGSYVGSGTAQRIADGATEPRDLDVQIKPYKDNGFTLKWITVILAADGDRVSEGVRRREVEESFVPYRDKPNVFIDAPSGGLFTKAELPNPLKGEPLRWAAVDGDTLTVYSMAITDIGGAELQVYHRTLTEKGMKVDFLRMLDEKIVIRLTGDLVKAN